jgi:hypothetical protein
MNLGQEREEMLKELKEIMREDMSVGLLQIKLEFKGVDKGLASTLEIGNTDYFDMIVKSSKYDIKEVRDKIENMTRDKLEELQKEVVDFINEIGDSGDTEKLQELLLEKEKKDRAEAQDKVLDFRNALKEMMDID